MIQIETISGGAPMSTLREGRKAHLRGEEK